MNFEMGLLQKVQVEKICVVCLHAFVFRARRDFARPSIARRGATDAVKFKTGHVCATRQQQAVSRSQQDATRATWILLQERPAFDIFLFFVSAHKRNTRCKTGLAAREARPRAVFCSGWCVCGRKQTK